MATTAATLDILVNARTQSATSSLRRMDTSARTSATHLKSLDKTSGRLTRTLGTAAKTALGAGAAYLSLSAAKKAVQDTTDLAKVTLGLQKNMGFTVKTASELGAQLQVRGADAKQAQQAFATFGGVLHQAGTGSASASAKLAELGITGKRLQRDLKDPQKGLFDVAEGLKNVGEGAVRTDDARKLFGRGWATLAPLLRDGAAGLKENLNEAGDLGAVFTNLGLKNMQDVIQAQRRMQLSSLGLKIAFTQAIAPAITAVSDKLADWGKIMNDPKLTNTQKFNKIATDLTNIVSKGITMAAEQAGKRAPQIAGALVKGFLNAPILGKLFLGAALITKVGGSKAWLFLGKKFGLALIEGLAGTKIGAAVLAQFPSVAKMNEEGRVRGGAMGSGMVAGLVLGTVGLAAVLGDKIASIVPNISLFSKGYIQKQFGYAAQAIQGFLPTMSNLGGKVAAAFRNPLNGGLFKGLAGDLRTKLFGPFQAAAGWITGAFQKVIGFFNGLPGSIKSAMKNVGGFLISPFRDAVSAISGFIHDIVNVINTVLGPIGVHIGGGGGTGPSGTTGNVGGGRGGKGGGEKGLAKSHDRQKGGGIFVGGSGSGDKVPAMLEPGEFVLNRNAVSAIGLSNVARVNKQFPRFQEGGVLHLARGGGSSLSESGGKLAKNIGSAAGGFDLPGLGSIPGWLKPAGQFVLDKAGGFIKNKLASLLPFGLGGGGGGASQGPSGVGSFMGVPMANWVVQSLQFAASKGVKPQPTAGWAPGTGHAAGSQHYLSKYPGGAVDYGWPIDPAALVKKMAVVNATRNFKWPLLAPAGFRDDGHASGTGHQKGGIIQRLQGGGAVRYAKWLKHGSHWLHPHNPVTANEGATLLWQAGMSARDAAKLSTVLPDESSGRWTADNPHSDALGVWQILGRPTGGPSGSLTNPIVNSIDAAIKWRTQGPGAWPTYPGTGPQGHIMASAVSGAGGSPDTASGGKTPAAPAIPFKLLLRLHNELIGPAMAAVSAAVKSAKQAQAQARRTPGVADDIAAFQQLGTAKGAQGAFQKALNAWKRVKGSKDAGKKGAALQALVNLEQGAIPQPDDASTSDAVDTYNQMIQARNDLISEGNLLALQGFQTSTSQAGILGIPPNAFPFQQMLAPQVTSLPSSTAAVTGGGGGGGKRQKKVKIPKRLKGKGPIAHYADGGIVPGPVGSPQMAVVHGGETITPPGGGGGVTHVHFYIDGKEIKGITKKETKREARRGRRPLPSSRRQ